MRKIHIIVASILLLVACQMAAPLGMTTPITPATPPTISLSLTGPADGEVANALSVNSVFQVLEDDAEAYRLLTYGGGIRRRVLCTSNTNMVIQPLGAVVVKSAIGVWTVFSHTTPTTVSPTTMTGGLTNNRWWVYAYDNAGSLGFIASTTAPDSGLRYKDSDEKYQYVTTFYVDSGPNVVPYNQNDNEYTYLSANSGNTVVTNGAATVKTNVPVPLVPSQAASFSIYCVPTSATDQLVSLYGTGQTDFTEQVQVNNTGVTNGYTRTVHLPIISTASFDYRWSGAPGGGNGLTATVQSFTM